MRTPSLYSQDDPITEALKPPVTETEAQRRIRLQEEAEAKRISEQIDEDLRQERELIKRKRGDVKLLLLGQAESGKSTLQKQFQLMYKPHSLDQERASWRTVIFFNVVRSIKHILTTLESWEDSMDDVEYMKSDFVGSSTSPMQSPNGLPSLKSSIASLRFRLSPLVALDTALADRLSGGVTVSGSGKGSVFVRSGWQARAIENALGRRRPQPTADSKSLEHTPDPLTQDVSRMLEASKDDIKELWAIPPFEA
ncbi:hypothetical protein VNI00_013233 [Paramarasmius palmivorus]|uniref:Uncharacterized protein n=1 Tax=Paramarasmius palmivorus TaxID=297713 RepID=A0AAW0BZZ2_9AGAR